MIHCTDIEDISSIRQSYLEAVRYDIVSNLEYSFFGTSNNKTSSYQTLINNNGVFRIGSPCYHVNVNVC